MKILHAADTHLGSIAGDFRLTGSGLQYRVKLALDTLSYIIDYANKNCKAIVLAGDIFDSASPSTRLLYEFNQRIQETKVPVIIILGQHDLPKSNRNYHSFPWDYKNSLIFIADVPKVINISGYKFICVPYSQQILTGDNWKHLNNYLKANSKPDAIIVGHFPIAGAKVSDKFAMRSGLPKEVFDGVECKKILMGDIHTAQILGDEQRIFYPGAPVYVSRAESGDKGFWVHNLTDNTQEFIKLNPEPLPKLATTIANKATQQKHAATNKVTVKSILETQFGKRTDRMIAMLEELGISDVLNNTVFASGQNNADK